jgi:hypothetical protein
MRYPIDVLNHKLQSESLDVDSYKFEAGNFLVTAITPVLVGKLQVMHEKRRTSNDGLQDPYYEWHRSTETSLDYAVTFDVRPASKPAKRSFVSRMVPPMLRFGQTTDMEFKGEFLEFRIYRDGELIEPIMPGRVVVAGVDHDNQRYVEQSYGGSYVYAPEEFLTGSEFRVQVIDARTPNEIHKEMTFTAESKLVKQLRADFTLPGIFVTQAQ